MPASRMASAASASGRMRSMTRSVPEDGFEDDTQETSGFDLNFIPLQTKVPFDKAAFAAYLVFLGLFITITTHGRGTSTYNLSRHARQTVRVNHFNRIRFEHEYKQWVEFALMDGFANSSVRAPNSSHLLLIGEPRIRQVRMEVQPCSTYLDFLFESCTVNVEDTLPFGGKHGKLYTHSTGSELNQGSHPGYLRPLYSGGGYLLHNVSKYIRRPLSKRVDGTEFLPFPHALVDLTDLWETGWLNSRTWAIFHDFTFYANNKDEFVNVRLLLEQDIKSGYIYSSLNLRVINLHDFVSTNSLIILEILFLAMLIALIFAEYAEFKQAFHNGESIIIAELVELRYRHRYKVQLHAAVHGSKLFDPGKLLRKLSQRLYLSDHINRHYIHELNQIGTDTQSLIDLYEDAISTHALTGGANAEAPFPAEHKWQVLIEAKRDELSLVQEDTVATCGISGKCFRRYWVQFLAAKRYYFRNKWNYIDVLNYFIFVVAVYLKLQCYILAPSVRDSISTLAQAGQIDKFVDVYAIGLQMALSNYIVAFNAVLTWVKIFKHLEFHSMIHVFTRTISTAAKTLGVFMFVFTIVVAGSAHGFCMAFGQDIEDFSGLAVSIMSTLRMAVGDFDYDAMYRSQRFLGPVLFWVFIFLVFFVLVSMFIALLSDAYDKAKDDAAHGSESESIWEAVLESDGGPLDVLKSRTRALTTGIKGLSALVPFGNSVKTTQAGSGGVLMAIAAAAAAAAKDEEKKADPNPFFQTKSQSTSAKIRLQAASASLAVLKAAGAHGLEPAPPAQGAPSRSRAMLRAAVSTHRSTVARDALEETKKEGDRTRDSPTRPRAPGLQGGASSGSDSDEGDRAVRRSSLLAGGKSAPRQRRRSSRTRRPASRSMFGSLVNARHERHSPMDAVELQKVRADLTEHVQETQQQLRDLTTMTGRVRKILQERAQQAAVASPRRQPRRARLPAAGGSSAMMDRLPGHRHEEMTPESMTPSQISALVEGVEDPDGPAEVRQAGVT